MIRTLLAALAILASFPAAARAEPPLWVVRDADSELVIFGSVHLLPPGLTWKPAALDRALSAADDLWFELPQGPAAEAEVGRIAARRGTLPPGQSLFGLLPPADAARLIRVARSYGVDPLALDRLQPWLAEVALAVASFRRAGAVSENGVEAVTNAAAPASVRRRAFETPAEQIDIFAQAPMTEQIAALRESLEELETEPDKFGDLVRAWTSKDLVGLEREALAPLREASPALFRRLVTDRNDRWAKVLDQRLKGSGRTVVVVGVGHLAGAGGLPAQLRALGYSVQGP